MISIKRLMENGVTLLSKIPAKPEMTVKEKPSVSTIVKQDGDETEQFDFICMFLILFLFNKKNVQEIN